MSFATTVLPPSGSLKPMVRLAVDQRNYLSPQVIFEMNDRLDWATQLTQVVANAFASTTFTTINLVLKGTLAVAGTLAVTGASTFSNNLTVNGTLIGAGGTQTGSITDTGGGFITLDSTNNAPKQVNIGTTNATNVLIGNSSTITNNVGNFQVNSSKFIVTASNGNTAISGTLNVTGAISTQNNISTSNGGTITASGAISSNSNVIANSSITAQPGGSTVGALLLGIGAGGFPGQLGIYFGSNAPTISAPQGSLYLRTDGNANNNRAYIATNNTGTWTAISTVA